jgi:hypothetical protein
VTEKPCKKQENPLLGAWRMHAALLQIDIWTLGPDEWLLFKKLPEYAVCTKRKRVDVIQLSLPNMDEGQQQAVSS